MGVSRSECERVVEELQAVLAGGWIQKIRQPQPCTLVFDIRQPGETYSLLICTDPYVARVHLTSKKFLNPPTPPAFCLFLRAHIQGGLIESVSQVPGDRLVVFSIVTQGKRYLLVVALTGRQSNVLVLNDQWVILRALTPSRYSPGMKYVPPPNHRSPAMGETRLRLRESREILSTEANPSASDRYESSLSDFERRFPVSAQLEREYGKREEEAEQRRRLDETVARLRKLLKQAKKKVATLEGDLAKASRYREYGRYGELLKGSFASLEPGAESATVIDYYDPAMPELTIPLDPTKDPTSNVAEYFRKYRKYLSAEKHVRPRLAMAMRDLLRLEDELKKCEQGEQISMTMTKAGNHIPSPSPRVRSRAESHTSRARGYREFRSQDGLLILVGKTAHDNDVLTFKIAAPDDLWLHARGTPGSHVVVRVPKQQPVPPETLRDAATLALWYSDLRKSGKGEVLYTRRKFVKKSKGQKPGAVHVSREKSLWISIDPERLERLKQGAAGDKRPIDSLL